MSCGNSDILALIDYFQNGTDLSNNDWDNYNYYDLWNAIENGSTPPNRTVCATFVQADIRSIVFAVLGVFTSPSDYLGENIDFYYLYLKAIGQEVVSPKFSNFCIGQLYNVFSIGLTAKFRQGQDFNVTMSKVAAIASITFEQGQQLDALLSKSAALQQVVFQQQQTFNAELAAGFTGLLDDYPGAAAAYSIRLLSSTYTGPLVRIRKDTGGQPEKDFYPDSNNELSLNSSDGGGTTLGNWIANEDGYIVTWYSQTGSNNATQSSASAQPQIISGGALNTINSKPALITSGDILSGTFSLTASTKYIFSVIQRSGMNNFIVASSGGGSPFFGFGQNLGSNDSWSGFSSVNNSKNGVSIANTRNDMYSEFSSQGLYTAVLDSTSMSNYSLGYNSSFEMPSMQEVIVYDSDQSSNQTGIETNINDFYLIY